MEENGREKLNSIIDRGKNIIANNVNKKVKIAFSLLTSPIFWIIFGIVFVLIVIAGTLVDVNSSGNNSTDDMYDIESMEEAADLVLRSYENPSLWAYINGTGEYSSYVKQFITEDKKYYKMFYTSFDGCLNYMYGIMVRDSSGNLNNEQYFKDEGLDLKSLINDYNNGGQGLVEVEKLNRIYSRIFQDIKDSITRNTNGVFSETQTEALALVSYQYGNCGQYFSGSNNVGNVYKTYGNTNNFKNNAVLEAANGSLVHFFVCGAYPDREESEWLLFHEGIYKLSDGTIITPTSSSGGAKAIINSAKKIHKYMEQNNYTYSLDVYKLASTFESSKQYKVTCCATYVSWVLIDAGYLDTCIHHCGTDGGIGPALRATKKFKELDITSLSQLQAGDIMWYPNQHVEICAGNGTIYNAGSTDAIQRSNPYASSRCPSKAFRCIETTNSGSKTADISKYGYDSIYTSSITGRSFKEFKQNATSYNYPSIPSNCSWKSECGTVSTIIVGSGYNSNVSMKTGADLLYSTGGSTSITGYINTLTKKSTTTSSTSVSTVRNYLKKGYVGVIHNPGYSGNGHYLAILDISSDGNKVYISNPDIYGSSGGANSATKQGWNNISTVCNAIDYIAWVSN